MFPLPKPDPDDVSILVNGDPAGGLGGLAGAASSAIGLGGGGGSDFKYWTQFELSLSLDSYSAAGFVAPFDYHRKEFREAFRPFTFKTVEVKIGGQKIFTGRMQDIEPRVDPESSTVSVTAYSLPKQLETHPPVSLLPLEFNGLDLFQIAKRLCAPFGVTVNPSVPVGSTFHQVKCDPDQGIYPFLVDLAKQRGLIIADNANGELLILRSESAGNPVARLEGQPVVKVTPTFSPEAYYSEMTGFAPKKSGHVGSRYTEKNPKYLGTNIRPLNFTLEDTEAADVPFAVRARLGRMFGNMVSYVVEGIPTWRDPKGNLWRPNTTITLKAPEAMIYRETEFLIRNVTLRQDAQSKTATLGLVLPGAFSGETPSRLPFEE